MSSGKQAKSLYHESTIQSADCIESHPTISGLFALGTYQVDQHEGSEKSKENEKDEGQTSSTSPEYSRKGTLRLKRVRVSPDSSLSSENVAEVETAAVLDMKWLHPSSSLLSLALADSTISLYSYKEEEAPPLKLELAKSIQVNTTKALCLSLDWSDRIGGFPGGYDLKESVDSQAIISQSDGTLSHLSSIDDPVVATWKAHEYEAWTTAFDCWSSGNVVWSGGDDLCLKGWDLRRSNDLETSIFTVKKCFEGGVTSMQSHHLKQHLWAIGSYDGHLRLFDARKTNRPISTTNVEGGIWRTKWHPTKADRLLLGCMHDGFKVMQLDSLLHSDNQDLIHPQEEMKIHTRFDEHASLAYGCDWDRGHSSSSHDDLIYSCSFYDAVWHAWRCDE